MLVLEMVSFGKTVSRRKRSLKIRENISHAGTLEETMAQFGRLGNSEKVSRKKMKQSSNLKYNQYFRKFSEEL